MLQYVHMPHTDDLKYWLIIPIFLAALLLAFVPWPRIRIATPRRLFVSALITGLVGMLLLMAVELAYNGDYFIYHWGAARLPRLLLNTSYLGFFIYAFFGLVGTSYGIVCSSLYRRFKAAPKTAGGIADANNLPTPNEAGLGWLARLFAIVGTLFVPVFMFGLWVLGSLGV